MNNLETYEEFNERLSSNQRSIFMIPKALISYVGKKLFGIYPMLNTKWSEMKKSTTDSQLNSPFDTSGRKTKLEKDIKKIELSDIPDNTLKYAMIFRSWNIYYIDKDYNTEKDISSGRSKIYITKDEIKKM